MRSGKGSSRSWIDRAGRSGARAARPSGSRQAAPKQVREEVLGDLLEAYDRLAAEGHLARLGWTWKQPFAVLASRMSNGACAIPSLTGVSEDLRVALRFLTRAPTFMLVAVATLAIAIGANTTIFSVVNTVLLDPLDFPEPDRLVSIRGTAPGSDMPDELGLEAEF